MQENAISKYIHYWCIVLFVGINLLFTYKYGMRQDYISVYVLMLSGTVAWGILLWFRHLRLPDWMFWGVGIGWLLAIIGINIYVDGDALMVDRWSAMDVGIRAVLSGEYPYTAVDHLDGRTSNLPGLFLLGLPAYLLGDVGYLQVYSFALFVGLLYLVRQNLTYGTVGILLLIASPAYMWEVFVKSDLLSNFIWIAALCYFRFRVKKYDTTMVVLFALAISVIVLTRLSSAIPLILAFALWFWELSAKHKVMVVVVGLVTCTLMLFVAFHQADSWEQIKAFNPVALQNRQLPFGLSVLFILLPFIVVGKVSTWQSFLKYNCLLLSLPILTAWILRTAKFGWNAMIFESSFDLSYFNALLPFIILYLLTVSHKRQKHIT